MPPVSGIPPSRKGMLVYCMMILTIIVASVLLALFVALGHTLPQPPGPKAKDVPTTESTPTSQMTLERIIQACERATKDQTVPFSCEIGAGADGTPTLMFLFENLRGLQALWAHVGMSLVEPFCTLQHKAGTVAYVSVSLFEEKTWRVANCSTGEVTPWYPWVTQEEKEEEKRETPQIH